MALNPNVLSATKLKELKSGEHVALHYATSQQGIENEATRIIYERFPKGVATAFSTIWSSKFPPLSKITLAEMSRPKQNSITIIGGSVDVVRMILKWMLSCCEGKGMQQFPLYTEKPFLKYYIIKENADRLGVTILSREMERRLNEIASRQIHSEDVRAMYLRLPADHPILKDIATHIADLIWNRQLKAFGAYRILREEIPQFDKDLNEVLEPRAKERWEERVKQRETEDKRPATSQKNYKGMQNKAGAWRKPRVPIDEAAKQYLYDDRENSTQSEGMPSLPASQEEKVESVVQHKTVRCSVARKAQGGRPAYVSLSLADAGVEKDDFTGDSFRPRALRIANPSKSAVSQGHNKQKKVGKSGRVTSNATSVEVPTKSPSSSTIGTTAPTSARTNSNAVSKNGGATTPATTVPSTPRSFSSSPVKRSPATASGITSPNLLTKNTFSALDPKTRAK